MPIQRVPLPFNVDPDIMSGTPVFQGTRVPINALLNNLAAGVSLDEFIENFPTVSRTQALSVLEVFTEDYYDADIASFLSSRGVPPPDLIFDACLLDRKWEISVGIQCPLRESRKVANQYLSGCYAWVQPSERDHGFQVMYVGKAARLGNRLVSHFLHSRFLDDWDEERVTSNRSFIPFIAIWFTKNRAAFESKLQKKLSPKCNRRSE